MFTGSFYVNLLIIYNNMRLFKASNNKVPSAYSGFSIFSLSCFWMPKPKVIELEK